MRVALALSVLLASPSAALAAPPLAGGHITSAKNTQSYVHVRFEGENRVIATVGGYVKCGDDALYFFDEPTRGRVDGRRLDAQGRDTLRLEKGRVTIRWRLRATTDDRGAEGRLVTDAERRGRPCKTLRSTFRLAPYEDRSARFVAPPRETVRFFGAMTQSDGLVRGMVLKLIAGKKFFAYWPATMQCRSGGTDRFPNLTPMTRIRQGRLSRRERFTVNFTNGMQIRYRVRFAGRFTSRGAKGTARLTSKVYFDGRFVDRCSSRQRWTLLRADVRKPEPSVPPAYRARN